MKGEGSSVTQEVGLAYVKGDSKREGYVRTVKGRVDCRGGCWTKKDLQK